MNRILKNDYIYKILKTEMAQGLAVVLDINFLCTVSRAGIFQN